MLSFGDFKKNEITEFISNKDPLGLNINIINSDIDSHTTIETKSQEAISPKKTNMEYDAIPHYLKAVNFNNSADTNKNKTKEDENIFPTLQVNPIRSLRSISSGNLAKGTSFKSFNSIQQSCKRSCTNSHDSHESLDNGNPSTSRDPNFTFTTNSNELIEQFNRKKLLKSL